MFRSAISLLAMGATVNFLVPMPVASMASVKASTKQVCNPIGRIAEGSSANFKRGQVVCSGQTISQPVRVQLLCFSSATLIPITKGGVINEATCRQNTTVASLPERWCDRTGLSRLLCFLPKGPEEQFQLIQPEAVSNNARPTISWVAVAETESYTVQAMGPGIAWQRTVSAATTEMAYPAEEASLTEGNAYEMTVVANLPQTSFTASKVVNIKDGSQSRISLRPERTVPSRMGG